MILWSSLIIPVTCPRHFQLYSDVIAWKSHRYLLFFRHILQIYLPSFFLFNLQSPVKHKIKLVSK